VINNGNQVGRISFRSLTEVLFSIAGTLEVEGAGSAVVNSGATLIAGNYCTIDNRHRQFSGGTPDFG